MRIFISTLATIVVIVFALPASAGTTDDIYASLDASSPAKSMISMDYLWVYGIEEKVELRGDGLVRVERHVHNREVFDGIRSELASRGKLSPYGQSISEMEEGDYDRYWVADIGPDAFGKLVGLLREKGYPDIEDTYGDWEVWAVTVNAGDVETRVGQVLRDYDAGFESIIEALEGLADTAKSGDEVDREDFLKWFDEPKSGMGGVS